MRTLRPARSRLKRIAAAVALCAVGGVLAAQPAFADPPWERDHHWRHRHHQRYYEPVYPPPVYYAPPPRVYYAPPPVVYAPPPGLSITIPLR